MYVPEPAVYINCKNNLYLFHILFKIPHIKLFLEANVVLVGENKIFLLILLGAD